MKVVCGDIGGTKALLAIADCATSRPHFVFSRRYLCADYGSFEELFAQFRDDAAGHHGEIRNGCIAVAGPVEDDGLTAKITNLPWRVEARRAGGVFGLPAFVLVNDFAAAATGIEAISADALVTLQGGDPLPTGVRLVIGAGTGLGMAILVPDGDGYRVLPGEGGHVGFSPTDDSQRRVHAALLAAHGRVTAERVISGPGLAAIHRELAGENATPEDIAQRAMQGDIPARQSVDCFLAAYGAYAGDMALAVNARGGVYLAGGIAAKMLPLLQAGVFMQAFAAKAEHAALAARMPVHVVTDAELGLKGAANIAARGLRL